MTRRLNDRRLGLSLLTVMFVFMTMPVSADVETLKVHRGEFISKDIPISPGFAVMFQFPQDVLSLTLADQTAFACDKMPSDLTRVICKPLTQSPFTTNLVISTGDNEFNLVLRVDPSGKKNPFKYVFAGGKTVTLPKPLKPIAPDGVRLAPSQGLMDLLLDHYITTSCRANGTNSFLKFRCLEIIEVGTERYLRFALTGRGSGPVQIIKLVLNSQRLGGLTGLSLTEVSSSDLDYSIKSEALNRGEETLGIIKLTRSAHEPGQRLCLVVMTDQGRQGDLRIYGIEI